MIEIVYDKSIIGPWVCHRTGGSYVEQDSQTIGLVRNGELVAGVLYDHYNGRSIAMHVAAIGKFWMTRQYLHACFHYPFIQLGVNKILGLVDSTNLAAQKFDEHLGFKAEAIIKDAAPQGDLIIYSMTAADCRFLGETNGRKIERAGGT